MSLNTSIANLTSKPTAYYIQTRPEMLSFIPKEAKRILDVGCAEGRFACKLKELLGAEVWGIEHAPAAAEVAKNFEALLNGVIENGDEILIERDGRVIAKLVPVGRQDD